MLKGKRGDRPEPAKPDEPAPIADTAPSDAPAAAPEVKADPPAAGSSSSTAAAPADTTLKTYEKVITTLKTYEKVITKLTVKHDFTTAELAEIADHMAQAAAGVYRIEKEKSESAAHFSAELKAANLKAGELVEKYNNRYEMREIECRVEWDRPEVGYKTFVSVADETEVKYVRMTDAEKQRAFVFDAGDGKPQ
jgi:hypothetical protein